MEPSQTTFSCQSDICPCNICPGHNFWCFWQNIPCNQNSFTFKDFWRNSFSRPKSFLWTTMFFGQNYVWTPKDLNILDLKYFGVKYFWTQIFFGKKVFCHKTFFGLYIFETQIIFGPKILFGPRSFFNPKFLEQKSKGEPRSNST